VRYADDFVVLARFIGAPILSFLTELLERTMGLTLNEKKTRILDLRAAGASLDFLSYTFRFDKSRKGGGRYLNQFPSSKALKRKRAEVKSLTCRRSALPLRKVVAELNRRHVSWGRYFCLGYPSESFSDLDDYTRMRLGRFARNRSQRPMELPPGKNIYAWTRDMGLLRLADPRVIAYLRGQSELPQAYR
jgi:RNA-directed DNA polymerase